ncbi:hypothetical protein FRC03_006078 [Tulasnella sp. 419]|nr:hypothetical protein FRC03_006078 [Tulasnella sp. 419]
MRAEVSSEKGSARSADRDRGRPQPSTPPQEDDQSEWERQEQQMLMQQQDRTMSRIGATLSTLAEQAGLMGREIVEHNEMLGDLEAGVDRTANKLSGAMAKMRKFVRDTEETKSGWCIAILIVQNEMSDVTQAKSASTATFVTALVTNAAVAGIQLAIFTVLRPHFKAIYEPRTYIPDEPKRVQSLASSMLMWPIAIVRSDYTEIKRTNGMDSYFFVRYLRMMCRVFLPIWLLSWALFMPLHSVGTTAGKTGLDKFTFGNVATTQQARYAAHLIFLYFMAGWIFWNIKKEMRHFIAARQRHLVDPEHSSSAQANTVLITGVPKKFLDEGVLAQLFSHLPGGAKAIWLNRNLKELPDLYDRRMKACNKLEGAEKNLLQTAAKLHLKAEKAKAKTGDDSKITKDLADPLDPEASLVDQLVPRDQRPTHRLPPFKWMPFGLPFMGQKVDTIDWCKQEILETTEALEKGRDTLRADIDRPGTGEDETYPPLNSAFVLFNQQIAAHLAAQSLTHNEPYRMAGKYTEVAPEDVIWGNLGLNPYEQKIRTAISYAATAGLIIFWAIPVAGVGIISNVYGLCESYSWLAWICGLPKVVVGLLQGVLPPVLLAVLMALLPIVLRLLAQFEGIPRRTGLELSLMTRFFIFQVIHSFLIVTLSGGLIRALPGLLQNPTSVPSLLAQNLPEASTFFLTYIILQGFTNTAGGLLQIVPLILYYVKLFLLGSTPRSIYNIKYVLRNVAWGTLFPSVSLITVIALVYTPLQPVMAGLAFATFGLYFQLWKYLFLYVLDQPASGDTGGLFFPKAIQHIFVGLYVQEICLCALFFLARNESGKASAIPQGALMIVLIVITAGYNIIINNSYGPLLHSLPLTLAHKSYGMPHEQSLPSEEGDGDPEINAEADTDDHKPLKNRAVKDKPLPSKHDGFAKAKKIESGGIEQEEEGNPESLDEDVRKPPTDFNHPASVEPQRPIWLPKDTLGLGEAEMRSLDKAGIRASTDDAEMNEKGKVSIDGRPPE